MAAQHFHFIRLIGKACMYHQTTTAPHYGMVVWWWWYVMVVVWYVWYHTIPYHTTWSLLAT